MLTRIAYRIGLIVVVASLSGCGEKKDPRLRGFQIGETVVLVRPDGGPVPLEDGPKFDAAYAGKQGIFVGVEKNKFDKDVAIVTVEKADGRTFTGTTDFENLHHLPR